MQFKNFNITFYGILFENIFIKKIKTLKKWGGGGGRTLSIKRKVRRPP